MSNPTSEEPYEFQAKDARKAKVRTIALLIAGGVLGIGVIAAGAFGISHLQHEFGEHAGQDSLNLPNGQGKFELRPFDRDQNRGQLGDEHHAPGHDGDQDQN